MPNLYKFYIDGIQLPINPPTLNIKVGSKNKTVELANGGDMTILKSPALTEISFTARLPQTGFSRDESRLPFLNAEANNALYYLNKLKSLKVNKKPFQFVVTRYLPNGKALFETNVTTVLEDFTTDEDANEGFDILVNISLKQYIPYTTKVYRPNDSNGSNNSARAEKTPVKAIHTVRDGDTLWALAKYYYGNGSLHSYIYHANKSVIEAEAKKRGFKSSNSGHWIFPGTKLTILEKE